ncbi:MAG: DUF4340 domain-containing protein [Limisphaerales bacterium]
MNWKSTWILLAATAVLFAFIWLVDRPIRQARLREASRVILRGVDPASVNSIEIKPRGLDEIHVVRQGRSNDLWQLTQPISYPAQAAPIKGLLDVLAGLQWQECISARELQDQSDAQEKYGFTKPLCEVSLQDSAASHKILIGQTSALGDQIFLEIVGNPDVYLVGTAWLAHIPTDKDQWRDLSLFDPARLSCQTIQVRSPGRAFDLECDPATRLWLMKKPVAARADSARINELLQRLQGLRVRQFVSDDPKADLEQYGLQASPQSPDLDLSFWAGSNLTAQLQVGTSPTNQPGLAFARRSDPGNVVVIDREALRPWQGAYTNFLDYHFISLSPDAIGSIIVQDDEGQFAVQKQSDGRWQVRAGTTFPADAGLIRDWLASFTNIQTQIEKTVATDVAEYGLTTPLLQYTLQAADGVAGPSNTIIARIEFGAGKNGRIFERRPDESFVNLINPEDFYRLPRAAWELRDRHIWTFETSNVVSLTVHQLGGTRKYLRDPEGEWTFAPGYHGPPGVNWPGLEEGVHRLGGLSAVYWSGVGEAQGRDFGFTKMEFSLSLEVKRGGKIETCSIEFGGRSPYSYPYASVTRDGQRLIFEFPVDLYDNFVEPYMTIPAALRYHP